MDMNEYQLEAGKTAIYPGHCKGEIEAVSYCTLGLAGEAGEVANKVKKILRDHDGHMGPWLQCEVADELGDVLWYVAMLARELNFNLEDIAKRNLTKLMLRQAKSVLQGSGDKR